MITQGSIEPEPMVEQPQVTVETSAFVDDFGAMYYEVYEDRVSFFFGKQADNIHIAFTNQALLNLAQLVNRATCATLRAQGIPVQECIDQKAPTVQPDRTVST